jgi:hypothetical protein
VPGVEGGNCFFLGHIDRHNPALGNGILAADTIRVVGELCEQRVTSSNLARILFGNLAAKSQLGKQGCDLE